MANFVPIKINEDTYNMLLNCKKDFLKHHPEFEQMRISNNKIIYEMAKYYLET